MHSATLCYLCLANAARFVTGWTLIKVRAGLRLLRVDSPRTVPNAQPSRTAMRILIKSALLVPEGMLALTPTTVQTRNLRPLVQPLS
jgi:hypothetical protein